MDKGIRSIIGLLMIVVGIIMFPMVMSGFHDTLTDEYSLATSVTTGVGETTADIVLTNPLWESELTSVLSITSTEDTDVATPSSYATATRTLTVSGLAASETRTLTTLYEYEAGAEYTGFTSFGKMGPLLILLGFMGGGVAIVIGAWKR